MSHKDMEIPLPAGQLNWDTIELETRRKVASRWSQLDVETIDSAVNLALAITYAMIQARIPVANVPGLVWTITYNTLSAGNRKPCTRKEVTNFDFERDDGKELPSPEDVLINQEFHQALETAIMELPEQYRVPFVAHLIHEVPYAEVAAQTGVQEQVLRNRVCKSKKMIRASLAKQGY